VAKKRKRPFFSKFVGKARGDYLGEPEITLVVLRFGALAIFYSPPFATSFAWNPISEWRADMEQKELWGTE
jgi:hypothetical protein